MAEPSWAGEVRLPGALIELPSSEYAIIVEKKSQTLYLYTGQGGQIRLVETYPCSTGENAGPKKLAGDKKTPEGVYFLKDEYEDRYLTPVYGKKAFPSDYPNFLDLRQGRQGSAIWIHGTDKPLKPMASNGCVAMENKGILALAKHIRLESTPLIILEEIKTVPQDDLLSLRGKLNSWLADWQDSVITGSYHTYLSFYADDYLPDISWWENWLKLRSLASQRKVDIHVSFENKGIYAHSDIVVALMDMVVSNGDKREYIGKRQLFIRRGQRYSIVGDLFQKKVQDYSRENVPLLAAARKLTRDEDSPHEILNMIEQWLAAWSREDIDAYAGYYSSDFYSDGLDKSAWIRRKKRLAKRYRYIHITGKDYEVSRKKDRVNVRFFQNYESSGFTTKGTKELTLVKRDGAWKIFRENWKEN